MQRAELEAELESESNRHRSNLEMLEHEKDLLAIARAEVRRAQRLKKQKLGSDSALDTARQEAARQALAVTSRKFEIADHEARLQRLASRLQRARSSQEEAELDYERSRLVAPFDGIIAVVEVAPGDRVRESDVLLKMYALNSLEVRARIPVRYQAEIQAALSDGQGLPAQAELSGYPIELMLDRLAGEADPSGIDGYFRVSSGAAQLRLGNLLKLQLQRPAQADLVPIPFQSIYGNNRIYLLREGRMHGIQVETVGQHVPTDASPALLIRSPEIKAGDRIIRTHLPHAVSGLKVKVAKG